MWVYESELITGGGGVVFGSLRPAIGFLSLVSRPPLGHWPGLLPINSSSSHLISRSKQSIVTQHLKHAASVNNKQNKNSLIRKLAPTFCCPSLILRMLCVCLDHGAFFSFAVLSGLTLDVGSLFPPGPGSDCHLWVGLRMLGAPGFPCETNDFTSRVLATKQHQALENNSVKFDC